MLCTLYECYRIYSYIFIIFFCFENEPKIKTQRHNRQNDCSICYIALNSTLIEAVHTTWVLALGVLGFKFWVFSFSAHWTKNPANSAIAMVCAWIAYVYYLLSGNYWRLTVFFSCFWHKNSIHFWVVDIFFSFHFSFVSTFVSLDWLWIRC